jgi:hypothetical protein
MHKRDARSLTALLLLHYCLALLPCYCFTTALLHTGGLTSYAEERRALASVERVCGGLSRSGGGGGGGGGPRGRGGKGSEVEAGGAADSMAGG